MVETDTAVTTAALAGAIVAMVGLLRPFLTDVLHLPKAAIPLVVLVIAEVITVGSVAASEVDLYAGIFSATISGLTLAASAVGVYEVQDRLRNGGDAPSAVT